MILGILVGLYRLNPIRPHCNSAAGIHTRICSFFLPSGISSDCYQHDHG